MDVTPKKERNEKVQSDEITNYSVETKPLNLPALNVQMLTLRKWGRNYGKRVR
jgi:hypothetical protein